MPFNVSKTAIRHAAKIDLATISIKTHRPRLPQFQISPNTPRPSADGTIFWLCLLQSLVMQLMQPTIGPYIGSGP